MMDIKILDFTMPTAKAKEAKVVDEIEDLGLPEVVVDGILAPKRFLIKKKRSVDRRHCASNTNLRISA